MQLETDVGTGSELPLTLFAITHHGLAAVRFDVF